MTDAGLNAGTVDLGGYYLTDDLTNRFKYQIPSGYWIPSGGHLLVWADNDPNQNTNTSADLHVNFKLAAGGDEIGLFAADAAAIDTVRFGVQTNNLSQGRYPDGSATILFLRVPTPRAANVGPQSNTPPQFTQTTRNGQQLKLVWQTAAGHTYRLQFKNDLNEPDWQDLGSPITDYPTATFTDTTGTASSRFYRVIAF